MSDNMAMKLSCDTLKRYTQSWDESKNMSAHVHSHKFTVIKLKCIINLPLFMFMFTFGEE